MHPHAATLWTAPRWSLALLLAALATLGPFSIDTYLPAFSGIQAALGATPVQMQQTLSAYLFGFAAMNLFHGAMADSFGRRPVVLWGLAVFTLASVGCALSNHIGWLVFFRAIQGMSAGAGIVVSRAIVRDMFPPAEAQKMMAQIIIYFGVAPAVAPIVGGFLFVYTDWHVIFWFLAAVSMLLLVANWRVLPETLYEGDRQSFHPSHLLRGYMELGRSGRFWLLALASGVPFNGLFLYVLASPKFLGLHLGMGPTEFYWFFGLSIAGIMGGSWLSGRLAGRIAPEAQVRIGFRILVATTVVNVAYNLWFVPQAPWALLPLAVYGFGWALLMPVVTIMVLDLFPNRRGMASSLQAFVASVANGIVAGALVPLVMHSTLALAVASALMMVVGLLAWAVIRPRLS